MSGIVLKSSPMLHLLEQWGMWTWRGLDRLGASSPALKIIEDNVEAKEAREVCTITDDLGMEIDKAICKLREENIMKARVIVLTYHHRMNFIDIAEVEGMTRQMASQLHSQAVAWLDGYYVGYQERFIETA